jgi:hypothetical protein
LCKEAILKSKNGEQEIKNLGLVFGQRKLIRGGLKPHAGVFQFSAAIQEGGPGIMLLHLILPQSTLSFI